MPKNQIKNPFELILEEMTTVKSSDQTKTKTTSNSNLNFSSLLRANDKRSASRSKITGYVEIYNTEGEGIARAVLRNVSRGGLGVETYPAPLSANMKVLIELSGAGTEFGRLKCTISWVASIDAHPKKHKMVGLSFDNKTVDFKLRFEKFVKSLSTLKR